MTARPRLQWWAKGEVEDPNHSDTHEASAAQVGDHPEASEAYGVPMVQVRGQLVLHPSRADLLDLAATLKADGFVQCVDLCAVDYLTHPQRQGLPADVSAERFEMVACFISHGSQSAPAPRRLRARVQVPQDDPVLPSLCDVYPGVENMEREIYDMFGIVFENHPDMSRILMPDEWDGHPLRRDYAVGQVPVQFKGAPS